MSTPALATGVPLIGGAETELPAASRSPAY